MTEPAKHDSDTPTVLLAGKAWPIPKLVPRQLRHCREALLEMNRVVAKSAIVGSNGKLLIDAFTVLSDEQYEKLLLAPVWRALTRAHPDMPFDELLDMDLDDSELVAAWFVVRQQSGLFIEVKEGGGADASAGEAQTTAQ